ncbi:hypothetical protein Droror1_Dr00008508 [Drosera rotundifolia]
MYPMMGPSNVKVVMNSEGITAEHFLGACFLEELKGNGAVANIMIQGEMKKTKFGFVKDGKVTVNYPAVLKGAGGPQGSNMAAVGTTAQLEMGNGPIRAGPWADPPRTVWNPIWSRTSPLP